jgi:single-stranded-DNA-specific exonuclease
MHARIEFMRKKWNVLDPCPPDFAAKCGDVHRVVPQLLWHRDVREPEEVESFFNPSYENGIHNPFLFTQMQLAVERTLRALKNNERILVFGDYDADGLTGSAVVISTLREIQKRIGSSSEIESYIPHRDEEGYGLQMAQVDRILKQKVNLLITVDCGIACPEEITKLRDNNIDTIVVDHHQFNEKLPEAILIHPSVPNETYPFKDLSAVGVAWKFACAFVKHVRDERIDIPVGFEKWLLDLVAIATVTDIVPLIGENRVLEHFGLKVLNKTRRHGLQAIIRNASVTPGHINARDIGFAIGPRLNAPGRMDHASIGLELLLSITEHEASEIADRIEVLNRSRKDVTLGMMREADEMLEQLSEASRLHVLWRDNWSPSLVGLVAGRVSDKFGMPVVAIGKHGNQWIGSGRSFPFYDITEAVKRVGDGLLTRAGGHVQACGFALASDEHVPEFAERLRQDALERLNDDTTGPFIDVHADLELQHIDWRLIEALEQFEPFGCGNPAPAFRTQNVEVVSRNTVGKDGRHLRIMGKTHDGHVQQFIAFGFGERAGEANQGDMIDIVYTLGINEWNGNRDIQCKVLDIARVRSEDSTSDRVEDRLVQAGLVSK